MTRLESVRAGCEDSIAMSGPVLRWGLPTLILTLILIAAGVGQGRAHGQAPTVNTDVPKLPGAGASPLGAAPGANAAILDNSPGAGTGILGGRPGATVPRVYGVSPSGVGPTALQTGITAPKPTHVPPAPLYGTFSIPTEAEDKDEGPDSGLTLDQAIDDSIKNNLLLRSKYYEIPQARADVLQASLRSNPIFYADAQLVPYGQFNRSAAGGPTQYDVNVSYPLDVTQKRLARTHVAVRAEEVLNAQYQDAVRLLIDDVYNAYIDVLAARQAVRYSESSVQGLKKLVSIAQELFDKKQIAVADVSRVRIQLNTSIVGLDDSKENYNKTRRTLAAVMGIPRENALKLEPKGTISDLAPKPPPVQELIDISMQFRPDLVSYRIGVLRAQADVKLAVANRYPDVYVLYQPYTFQNNQPYGIKSTTSWALGLTAPIPVFNRNQGGIARAKLNVTQTKIELANLERQTAVDVEQAYKEYEVTRRSVERIRKDLLPDATRVREDSLRLYLGGQVDLATYLNAQRDYNDIAKQYLDTAIRHRRSMLLLNTSVGQRILP